METKMKSKYRSYCNKCYNTIWQGEDIVFNGKPRHVDCKRALLDKTPRVINPLYERQIGKIDRKKLKAALKG